MKYIGLFTISSKDSTPRLIKYVNNNANNN